jgi:hypothetical protein
MPTVPDTRELFLPENGWTEFVPGVFSASPYRPSEEEQNALTEDMRRLAQADAVERAEEVAGS